MADPVSVAATVFGLVGASIKLTGRVEELCQQFQRAPQTATSLMAQMSVMNSALTTLNRALGLRQALKFSTDSSECQQIFQSIDLATLSIAKTFSVLDDQTRKLRFGSEPNEKMSLIGRTRFMWVESDLRRLMQELRDQQTSLNFLVTCLNYGETINIKEKLNGASEGAEALKRATSKAKERRRTEVPNSLENDSLTGDLKPILKRQSTLVSMEEESKSSEAEFKMPTSRTPSGHVPPKEELPKTQEPTSPKENSTSTGMPSINNSTGTQSCSTNRAHHALHLAVTDDRIGNVRYFMSTGYDPLALPMNPYGSLHNSNKTPFCLAAFLGREQILQYFLDHGYGRAVNGIIGNDLPPLLAASYAGHENVVKMLLKAGADIKLLVKGNSSLFWASARGHVKVVQLLIDNGARDQINLKNAQGLTPLIVAAQHGRTTVVECLLRQGANVRAANLKSQTAMHLAAHGGYTSTIKALLAGNAPAQQFTTNGKTPLTFAAARGFQDIAKILIKNGATPSLEDAEGKTPLYHAALGGHADTVEALLENSAGVDDKTKQGDTPLHIACEKGHSGVVGLLLDHGASLTETRQLDGLSALDIAIWYKHSEIIGPILLFRINQDQSKYTKEEALYTAANWSLLETMDALIESGADINAVDGQGQSLIARAIRENQPVAVTQLIAKGADVSRADKFGATPLHRAARAGSTETAKQLMDAGVDIEAYDNGGHSALHIAAIYADAQMVDFLIEHGANIERLSLSGESPLMVAAEHQRIDVISTLIQRGAWIRNSPVHESQNSTPLFHAGSDGEIKVIEIALVERFQKH